MWHRSEDYLRENWGAPFVLAFIVLLITSAVYLSVGNSSTANNIAVYAFYALVLGVILQIASYVKYGEGEKEETTYVQSAPEHPGPRITKKSMLAIIIVVIILVASGTGVYYFQQKNSRITNTLTSISTHTKVGPLQAGLNFIVSTPGPNGSIQITIGINETGGVPPYNFTAYWSDGINQTNGVGVFVRSFLYNETVPSSLTADVSSSDGQFSSFVVTIPTNGRITDSSRTISQTS